MKEYNVCRDLIWNDEWMYDVSLSSHELVMVASDCKIC